MVILEIIKIRNRKKLGNKLSLLHVNIIKFRI